MRKISFFLASVILFAACTKEIKSPPSSKPDENLSTEKPLEIKLDESTIFLVDGKSPMTYAQFEKSNMDGLVRPTLYSSEPSIIVDFNGTNYIFTNDNQLRSWANSTAGAKKYADLLDTITNHQNYAISRGMLNNDALTEAYTDSLILATSGPNPFMSGLYDGYDYTGTFYWYPVVSLRPTFGSFNDRASSLADYYIGIKINVLCTKTWFRGRKFFYGSWRLIGDLRTVNFDNTARSKI